MKKRPPDTGQRRGRNLGQGHPATSQNQVRMEEEKLL